MQTGKALFGRCEAGLSLHWSYRDLFLVARLTLIGNNHVYMYNSVSIGNNVGCLHVHVSFRNIPVYNHGPIIQLC